VFEQSTGRHRQVYDAAAKAVLDHVVSACNITKRENIAYLNPLAQSARTTPIWIASLNYDNVIELAMQQEGVPLDLGLSGSAVRFHDDSPVILAKLHGSTNWRIDANGHYHAEPQPVGVPLLVFGSGNKLRVDGPYMDLLFAFRNRLELTLKLSVCGYSFRDQHINHLILSWLTLGSDRLLDIVDPCLSIDDIAENASRSLPNGSHLAYSAFAKRTTLISETAGTWFSRAFGKAADLV
jgi:hypothetical protein